MSTEYTKDGERLQDVKNGKKQPWREKKMRSVLLSDSFGRLKQFGKAERVKNCSMELEFNQCVETGKLKLVMACFCRERLCPMCQWRKSRKIFFEVSQVMDEAERQRPDIVPLFLTLTVKNCKGEALADTLGKMFRGWKNFINHRKINSISVGWFRALEITYNRKTDEYHPHFHVMFYVEKSYFKGGKYMSTADFVRIWGISCKLDYDPICDVRKVKNAKDKKMNAAEVAKYTLKDSEYITQDEKLTDKLIGILGPAMKGRRLYDYGGLLKIIAKQLGKEEPEEGDLIHVDGEIREDVATILIKFRWGFGVADYVRR